MNLDYIYIYIMYNIHSFNFQITLSLSWVPHQNFTQQLLKKLAEFRVKPGGGRRVIIIDSYVVIRKDRGILWKRDSNTIGDVVTRDDRGTPETRGRWSSTRASSCRLESRHHLRDCLWCRSFSLVSRQRANAAFRFLHRPRIGWLDTVATRSPTPPLLCFCLHALFIFISRSLTIK